MLSQALLHSLRERSSPQKGTDVRVWRRISTRTTAPILREVHALIDVPKGCQQSIWSRVQGFLSFPGIDIFASPAHQRSIWLRIHDRLVMSDGVTGNIRLLRWGVGLVAAVVILKIVPAFFVVTSISAESRVMVFPTRGEVSISGGETGWVNLAKERSLLDHSVIRTRDGEATVVLHDDGVVRLAPYTAIELHDLSDRPVGLDGPTLTLIHGKIWVQGLLPAHVDPLHIAMSYGDLMLHEGSVSIEEGTTVTISMWDRRATVIHDTERLPLVAGEQTWLWERNIPIVQRGIAEQSEDVWVSQNLERDAVHRQDIAQFQRKQSVALAGILPTSSFYPVKRVAESIDLFLTFGTEARIKKQLEQASLRLNEAAALVVNGGEPEPLLSEYRDVLHALGELVSNDDAFAKLVAGVLQEDTASISSAFPGEEGYLLKQAVLEVAVMIGSDHMSVAEIKGVLLRDAVMALLDGLRSGEVMAVQENFAALIPSINLILNEGDLQAELRKELNMLLSDFALVVQKRRNVVGDISTALYDQVIGYLPTKASPVITHLTDEEVQNIAGEIMTRVLSTFAMRRSRENQLWAELKALRGHPDRARILRRLYQEFGEEPWYAAYVREEMKFLREEQGLL